MKRFVLNAAVLSVSLLGVASSASAVAVTWSGATNSMALPTNWVGGVAPVSGDGWVFDAAGAGGTSLNNDLTTGTPWNLGSGSINAINFLAAAPAYTINGNGVTLAGNIDSNSSATQVINLPMTIGSGRSINLNTATSNVVLAGNLNFTFTGTSNFVKTGSATLTLSGSNTFSGAGSGQGSRLNIRGGTLAVGSATAFALNATPGTSIGAALDFNNSTAGTIFDLNGFNAVVQRTANDGAAIITNSGSSDASFTLLLLTSAMGARITDGATNKTTVRYGNNTGGQTTTTFNVNSNTALSNYSGGFVVFQLPNGGVGNTGSSLNLGGASATQQDQQLSTTLVTPGDNFSGIVSGQFGRGKITFGEIAPVAGISSERAGLFVNSRSGQTIYNDIVINNSNGNGANGIVWRFEPGTVGAATIGEHNFFGKVNLNADLTTASTASNDAAIGFNNQLTGPQGLSIAPFFNLPNPTATEPAKVLTVTLKNATANLNDYLGNTSVGTKGILVLGAANQIPNGSGKGNVFNSGIIRLGGFDATVNGLSDVAYVTAQPAGNSPVDPTGKGIIDNNGAANVTLSIGNNNATGTSYAGAITNTAGTLTVRKLGSGTMTLKGNNTYSGGTLLVAGILKLGGGALTNVTTGASYADVPTGTTLLLDYTASPTLPTDLTGILRTSYLANFTGGHLRSSTANSSRGLGWTDDTATSTITLKPALYGDTTVDGTVNFDDLLALAQNYGATSGATWAKGDSNYDGAVNFDDLLVLAQNYGGSLLGADQTGLLPSDVAADWALAQSLVPEPTTLFACAAFGGLGVRRRGSAR